MVSVFINGMVLMELHSINNLIYDQNAKDDV